MFPTIKILGRELSYYGIMALIGILVTVFYCLKELKKKKIDNYDFAIMMLWILLGVIVGSHFLYFITNFKLFIKVITHLELIDSFKTLLIILNTLFGGSVFYGGYIGGVIAYFIYAKVTKLDRKIYDDILAICVPLFHLFGRIGCFLAGCCYGIESHVGFTYHYSLVESANGILRFPIQLVESFGCLVIFLIMHILYKKGLLKNKLAILYLLLYTPLRFVLEFFRGDEYRGFLWIFSTSQWISLCLLIISITILVRSCKKIDNRR